MKKIAFIFLFAFMSIWVFSQSAAETEGCVPFAVQFDGTGFFWDFGNGQESTEDNPSAVYNSSGTFSVEVYKFKNGPLVTQFDIKVYEVPTLTISANVTRGCEPLEVDFSYDIGTTDIPIVNANWVFGDGFSTSTLADEITHTYQNSGSFNVTLELETGLGSCDVSKVVSNFIEVIDRPEVSFTANPGSSCTTPATISFTNSSTGATNFQWDFGNGVISTAQDPANVTYTADGNYQVQLVGTNADGCSDTSTYELIVGSPSGVIDAPDTVCMNAPLLLEYFQFNNVEWSFSSDAQHDDGSGNLVDVSNITSQSVEVYFQQPGTKTITLTTRNGGCSNSVTKDIFVQQVEVNPVISEAYTCENPVVVTYTAGTNALSPIYEWTFYNDSTATTEVTTQEYFAPSDTAYFGVNGETIYTTQLKVTDGLTGCVDSTTVDFSHYPINAKALLDNVKASGCVPLQVSFLDSISSDLIDSVVQWTWHFGDGSSPQVLTSSETVTHTYTSGGTYEAFLAIENRSGCTDSSYSIPITVGVDVSSSLDFTADQTTVCLGDELTLSVTSSIPNIDAFHFYADGNRIFHQPEDSVVNWTFDDETGPQDVTLMVESDGCVSEMTKTDFIQVNGAKAALTYSSTCEDPYLYEFQNNSTSFPGTASVDWEFGDGTSSSDPNPSHVYTSRGGFEVILTASEPGSGCDADTFSTIVKVREPIAALSVPIKACAGTEVHLDASGSQDAACRGYTFRFPTFSDYQRPITWDKDTANVVLPDVDTVGNRHVMELIITDDNGCKDTTTAILEPVAIDVRASTSVSQLCSPQEAILTDLTVADTTIASWEWIISNGDTLTTQNAQFTALGPPPNDTTFEVSLHIVDVFGCESTNGDTILSIPYVPLQASLNVLTDSICAPSDVLFEAEDIDGLGLDFLWDFGNGVSADVITPSTRYDSGGFYHVLMKFTQSTTGCFDSLFTDIEIQESPDAGFYTSVDDQLVYCNPQTIVFTDTSRTTGTIDQLTWDFDNGETSRSASYTLAFSKGTYDVMLTASTSFGCESSVSRSFEIQGPEGTFQIDNDRICVGESVFFKIEDKVDVDSLVWIFGDGANAVNVDSANHQYTTTPASFLTVANLLLYSDNGCFQAVSDTVNFHQLAAGFRVMDMNNVVDSVMCAEELFTVSDESTNADVLSWDFGDGNESVERTPTYSYQEGGMYSVLQVVENTTWGCVDSLRRQVYVNGIPEEDFQILEDTICYGDPLEMNLLSFSDSSSYIWNGNGTDEAIISASVSSTPEESFVLNVSETNSADCFSEFDFPIMVVPPIVVNDWDTTLQKGKSVRLPIVRDSEDYIYELVPTTGLSCIDCDYPVVSPEEDVVYTMTVSDIFGCFSETYTMTVFVIPPSFISMPDSFTPNGDGVNDVVTVKGWYLNELLEFKVFNRWGEEVYSSTDMDKGWDGSFLGKRQPSGIYAYKVRAIGADGNEVKKEGYINLIN